MIPGKIEIHKKKSNNKVSYLVWRLDTFVIGQKSTIVHFNAFG